MEAGTGTAMNLPPAMFVGDAPGLDFLNSVATPVDTPVDWIADGEGFLNWLAQAHLVPNAVLGDLKSRARPGELDKVAQEARNLREWFRGFVRRHKERPLTAKAFAELEPINRLLARDQRFSQIACGPSGAEPFVLQSVRHWHGPETLLLPIAEALAQLVCSEDFSNVKACEGATCTLLFVDHTRGHARRWCSMAICGNRAKQAAHRHRQKAR
jgi:predicted RNA-binding Zn ribbon-like protein